MNKQKIVNEFHKLYYNDTGRTWNNSWFGVRLTKCPLDLWVFQEIIWEVKPDIIIEFGTFLGGTTLFLACLCSLMNRGQVISVDNTEAIRPNVNRITYLLGDSVSDDIYQKIENLTKDKDRILIIEDSDHRKAHVLKELRIYNKFVTVGSYFIVEDTNVNGHPVFDSHGEGPMEAVEEFLKENDTFIIDHSKEKYYLTFNPNGYLKRIK